MKRAALPLNRRQFMKISAGAAALSATAGETKQKPLRGKSERPHILLLMADQFRGDCLGVDGHPAVKTPHLDRLAREGVRFSSAYSCTPTCTPARAALLTGLGPWRNGMLGYGRVAERYSFEKPRALRAAGYYTLGIGKMHWHPQRNLHGFHDTILDESGREESVDFRSDYRSWFQSEAPTLNYTATGIGWNDYRAAPYVLPERLHPTHWTGETAVRFLKEYDRPEPFFLKVSFARPHSPYDPPARFWKQYEDAPIPEAYTGNWDDRYRPRSKQKDPHTIWHGDVGADQVRQSRQGYYGSISFIDEQVGRILEVLEQRGWLEETLVLFTADHGDMTGDHYLWRKSYAYEPSARIPMLIRWPQGFPAGKRGQVCTAPVELRDILPTFLESAGAPVPAHLEGRSLLPLLQGKTAGWRPWIDLEHDVCYSPENHWNALTDGQWKYIFHARDGEEQLFHLAEDPGECHDLSGDTAYTAELRKWRSRLVEHLAERGEAFVRNGKLVLRPESMLYSPNYPVLKG